MTLQLNLACGKRHRDGWVNVDISRDVGADIVWDLRHAPWPWTNRSVERAYANHFLEHLDGTHRVLVMEELFRVLVPGGQAQIVTPYAWSWRAVADPTHVFPPIVEQSYLYFNAEWRKANGLDHYDIQCDFDFEIQYVFNPDVSFPDDVARSQGMLHYLNVVDDLSCLLTKRG